ncbi:MAG: alpha/beta hydrolase [Sandaracinaceae bacterium]
MSVPRLLPRSSGGWVRLLAAVGVAAALAAVVGPLVQHERMARKIVRAPNATRAPDGGEPPDGARELRVPVGPPEAELEVWVLDPEDEPPRGTVVVLHGIQDRKRSQIGVGQHFVRCGLRAVLVDVRGHGGSTGRFVTYGAVETRDLVQVLARLEADGLLVRPVGAHGPSYGGALAILLAGADPRVRALSVNSAYADVEGVARAFVADAFPNRDPPDLYVSLFLGRATAIAGFDPADADVEAAMARSDAAAMLAHGAADRIVPFTHAERLQRACADRGCELMRLEGLRHQEALASQEAGRGTRRWLCEALEAAAGREGGRAR